MRKAVFGFSDEVRHNQALKPHKMIRGLKFRIYVEKRVHYLCSKSIGADQLQAYRVADLCLFLHMQKTGFLIT